MKSVFSILFFFEIINVCLGQNKDVFFLKNTNLKEGIDTIIEKNTPDSIDFSKHQLFIDTTRSCNYYQRTKNWNPFFNPYPEVIDYINDLIIKGNNPTRITLGTIQRVWLTLRKFNEEFILYERCDGFDPTYVISDTTFIIYGPFEFDANIITKLVNLRDNEINLELGTVDLNRQYKHAKLSINRSEYKNVYLFINCNAISKRLMELYIYSTENQWINFLYRSNTSIKFDSLIFLIN